MKDTKHVRRIFYSVAWVMPQGWDFWALGCSGGQTLLFFKHGHEAYQIDGDDEQNRMQVNFSSQGKTGDLGVMSKGQLQLYKPIYNSESRKSSLTVKKSYNKTVSDFFFGRQKDLINLKSDIHLGLATSVNIIYFG